MADSILVQSKVKTEQKELAEKIFHRAGLSMGDAIRLFLQQTINADDIPFTITARQPSARLLKAMRQAENGEGETFDSVEAMIASRKKQRA